MSNTISPGPATEYKVYSRRWAVIISYILLNAAFCVLWATFFSITTASWQYYGFTERGSGESALAGLSMIVMLGMVILSIPSFWVFEKLGWFKSVAIGAVIIMIGGMVRGIFGDNFQVVLATTVFISIAQPLILNPIGMLATKWFPPKERATANGWAMFSIYLGVMIAMFVGPWLLTMGVDIKSLLMIYGWFTLAAGALFLLVAREAPPTPVAHEELTERLNVVEGFKIGFRRPAFIAAVLMYFCVNGIYGSFTTLIEPILNFFADVPWNPVTIGTLGVVITIAGAIGTVVIPWGADRSKSQRRMPYVVGSLIIGGIAFLTFILFDGFTAVMVASILYGFFITGIMPVLLVVGAEAAYPASEGSSQGTLQLFGNLGSFLVLALAQAFGGNHLYTTSMLIGLTLLCIVVSIVVKEGTAAQRRLHLEHVPADKTA
jgi:FLVCR family feline leukemia virus subgroup C receptor-related protein